MNTLATAARAAHAAALAYQPSRPDSYCFYCCNALAHAAFDQRVSTKQIEAKFDELFGDAAFWVGDTPEGRPRLTVELNWEPYDQAARHADRIDVLDLFATILESEDD